MMLGDVWYGTEYEIDYCDGVVDSRKVKIIATDMRAAMTIGYLKFGIREDLIHKIEIIRTRILIQGSSK